MSIVDVQPRHDKGTPDVAGRWKEFERGEAEIHLAANATEHDDGEEGQAPEPITSYNFPSWRLAEAVGRIDAANKKLKRAGIEERFTYTTEEYLKKAKKTEFGVTSDQYELRTKLELNEPVFSYGGWTFVAALDNTENGFIARTAPGQSLDGWRPDAQECDHCGLRRKRKATYILTGPDRERKQIGSNCLEPFLGVEVKGLWALGYDFDDLSDLESDPDGRQSGGGGSSAVPTRELIVIALAVSDKGASYMSRTRAMEWEKPATADAVGNHLYGKSRTQADALAREEANDRATSYLEDGTVDAVLAAAATVDDSEDYGYNLKVALAGEWVGSKHTALAISAISVWRRGQERAAAKASIKQGFVAPVGDKIKGLAGTVTRINYVTNPFDYNGGQNTIVMFQTPDGQQIKWFASGVKEYKLGDTGTFTGGTVKEHGSYKGNDETVVTRVKFEPAA